MTGGGGSSGIALVLVRANALDLIVSDGIDTSCVSGVGVGALVMGGGISSIGSVVSKVGGGIACSG